MLEGFPPSKERHKTNTVWLAAQGGNLSLSDLALTCPQASRPYVHWVCVRVFKSLAFAKACYLHSESPVDYKDHLSLHFHFFIHILTCAFRFHHPRSWTFFLWLSKEVRKRQTFPRCTVMQMLYSSTVHCLEFLTSTVFGQFCTFKSHVKMYESLMNCIDKLFNHVICTQMLLELFSEVAIFKYF